MLDEVVQWRLTKVKCRLFAVIIIELLLVAPERVLNTQRCAVGALNGLWQGLIGRERRLLPVQIAQLGGLARLVAWGPQVFNLLEGVVLESI